MAREAVEALFQRLASRALGTPVPATDLPHGRDVAAALVILRECMHHLGFERGAVRSENVPVDPIPGDESARANAAAPHMN
jgi:hypothetical protein